MNLNGKSLRRITIPLVLIGLITISCTTQNPPVDASKKTAGTLSVSTLTSSNGGPYAPRNVVAIWVENSSGQFVKTLLAYGGERRYHLTNWTSNSSNNVTDAITGATQSSHATRTCTWNGKDASGNLTANGNYKLCMELADSNGSSVFKTFAFAKDTVATTQSPSNVPSFANISIKWKPN